jgi:hypoxanthine-guanine phosphoribosyltransferase
VHLDVLVAGDGVVNEQLDIVPAGYRDKLGEIVVSTQQIRDKVEELGAAITVDYEGKEVTLIGVLKGASLFLADLARQIHLPLRFDFKEGRQRVPIPVKYEGFRIGPEFVVGYGLDFQERFRNLSFLAVLNEHPETKAARRPG